MGEVREGKRKERQNENHERYGNEMKPNGCNERRMAAETKILSGSRNIEWQKIEIKPKVNEE